MMSIRQILCHLCFFVYFSDGFQDSKDNLLFNLQKKLLANYSKSIIPGERKDSKNTIRIKYFLRSVNDFNEVSGHLQTTGVLGIVWRDERLKWDYDHYPVRSVTFSINDVWIPNVIIANPVQEFMLLHSKSNTEIIRLKHNGVIQLFTGGVLATSCTPNVRFFPFDSHRCEIVFTLLELFHSLHVLDLTYLEESKAMDIVEENAKWKITQHRPYVSSFGDTSFVYVAFPLTLERKPMFFLITIIAPVVVLSILNVCVFFIPAQAGERISFAVSSLLSFAVYMTILSSEIPDNSDPVPILSYLLMVKFGVSAAVAILTVFVVHIFHRDDNQPIPKKYRRIVGVLCRFRKKKSRKNRWPTNHASATPLVDRNGISDAMFTQETAFGTKDLSPSGDVSIHDHFSTQGHQTNGDFKDNDNQGEPTDDDLTWQHVSRAVDKIVFWIVFSFNMLEIIVWLVVTGIQYYMDHFE
ncbi:acetylcholine receptor subunit beta-like [Ylistrum balloti]|uniref:acetylcholine receptor subunit beta-like n=1 Tax=Ylistrum balloti TaxID=509963 RepID=UPI002905C966|nr:acetylcholine receptor subunit beta-like [Ylistrum balloti]